LCWSCEEGGKGGQKWRRKFEREKDKTKCQKAKKNDNKREFFPPIK